MENLEKALLQSSEYILPFNLARLMKMTSKFRADEKIKKIFFNKIENGIDSIKSEELPFVFSVALHNLIMD